MMNKLEESRLGSRFADFVSALSGPTKKQRPLPATKPERLPVKSGRIELATVESS
jgi:hypothetical protein